MDPNSKPSDILMDDTRAEVIDLATHLPDAKQRPAASLPVGAALLSALGFDCRSMLNWCPDVENESCINSSHDISISICLNGYWFDLCREWARGVSLVLAPPRLRSSWFDLALNIFLCAFLFNLAPFPVFPTSFATPQHCGVLFPDASCCYLKRFLPFSVFYLQCLEFQNWFDHRSERIATK